MSYEDARDEVRNAILERGLTPRSFAEVAEMDPGTIYDFLSGKRYGSDGSRAKIEKALGWPVGTIRKLIAGQPLKAPEARPVGLGLDDEAADLAPEQVEAIRALIRSMKPSEG